MTIPLVVLVRHASAKGQEADAPLTSEGEQQAHRLSDVLRQFHVQRVIASPFVRVTATIQPFCNEADLRLETDERLVERVLSGRNVPDWRDHLRSSFDDLDYSLEGGESGRTAQARGTAVIQEALASRVRTVVVTHGNLLALMLKSIDATVGFDVWAGLSNPDLFVLQAEEGLPTGFSRVLIP